MKNILNIITLLLFFLFSFLLLFLYLLFYCEANTDLFFLGCNYEKPISYILEEKLLYYFSANSDNSSENTPSYSCININSACSVSNIKNNISILFNELKNDTKFAMHKIKVFDRTLSWIFKRNRPNSGRGV